MTAHPMVLNADQVIADRCPVCGSVFGQHECHGGDGW